VARRWLAVHYGQVAIGSDWQRVADYVRERRIELDMTQADVQAAGGPSPATQRMIEGALQTSYQPVILARLERALGWGRGSIRAIRSGGEPVPSATATASGGRILSDADLDRMERRLGVDLSATDPVTRRTVLSLCYALTDAAGVDVFEKRDRSA
jgi:hypothetical protein